MAKIKLTKTELKAQTDALKRFQQTFQILIWQHPYSILCLVQISTVCTMSPLLF